MIILHDRATTTTQRRYTDEGFLIVPVTFARTGIQEYHAYELGLNDVDPFERVRVYRPPEEVFSAESMESFRGKPVTDGHPPSGEVNSETSSTLSKGAVIGDPYRDGDYLKGEIAIHDGDLIRKVNSGKDEVSNGYRSEIVLAPGTLDDGSKYDAVQRGIRGNHVAVVGRGRAGRECRIADSEKTGAYMMLVTIGDVQYETDNESLAQAVSVLKKSLADAESKLETSEASKAELEKEKQAELDKKQAELDDAKSKKMTDEQLDQIIEERVAVATVAASVVDGFDVSGKTVVDMQREVVASIRPATVLDGKSDDYIGAIYEIVVEDHNNGGGMKSALSGGVSHTTNDSKNIVDEAREKFIEKSRTLHNKGAEK